MIRKNTDNIVERGDAIPEAAVSKFKPVRSSSVVQSIQDHLSALITERALKPGDLLPPERLLMEALEVGRSSLREALSGLVALGVLTPGSRWGYRVRSLTPPPPSLPPGLRMSQIEELFEARRVLEAGIAELACVRAAEQDFQKLEACLESIQRACRARRSTAPAAGRFHILLAQAAHNGLLEAQLQGIRGLMVQVGLTTERSRGSRFNQEQWESHRALLDVLRTRDPAAMRAAMLAHLERFAEEAHDVTEADTDPQET